MLMRCLDAVLPQRREAVTERLGLLGEQPSGKALRRRHMGALALYDRRGEPERHTLMSFGHTPSTSSIW
jgi:hypothetical protein